MDIPGVTDANKILEELGKPGSLQFLDENMQVVLEGTDVATASPVIYKDETGANKYEVSLTFTEEGTKKFADVTAANVGKHIAIVYDGMIYSLSLIHIYRYLHRRSGGSGLRIPGGLLNVRQSDP